MTTRDEQREALADLLDDHGDVFDRDGDYAGECWCGWKEPDGWRPFQPSTWRDHLRDAILAAGFTRQPAPHVESGPDTRSWGDRELVDKWQSAAKAARASEHHFPADCLEEAVSTYNHLCDLLDGEPTDEEVETVITAQPAVGDDPIPRYAQLDIWTALYGVSRSEDYTPYRDEHGFASTWADLCAEVRKSSVGEPTAEEVERVSWFARFACGEHHDFLDLPDDCPDCDETSRIAVRVVLRAARGL